MKNPNSLFSKLFITGLTCCFLFVTNNAGATENRFEKINIQEQSGYNSSSIPSTEEIIFKDEKGEKIPLSSLKGKVVFINFWATWCLPCRAEMPSIKKLKDSFDGDERVVFLMVDVDDDFNSSVKYIKKRKLGFTVYAPASKLPSSFLNHSIPTTVVLDKGGKIAFRAEGAVNYASSKMRTAIKTLVEE